MTKTTVNKNSIEKNCKNMRKTRSASSNQKRSGYLSWDDYFMGVAFLSGQRSKDPDYQVGACIVNDEKRIVGVGYNGMPNNCSDDKLPWGKNKAGAKGKKKPLDETKHGYVCHAELNAIVNKNSVSLKNCSMYVSLFPCNECAKLIIQSGIKMIYYYSDKDCGKPFNIASKTMLDAAKVGYQNLKPAENITIDFKSMEK